MKKIIWYSILFSCFFTTICCKKVSSNIPEKPMVIVVPSYNNQQWCEGNLTSIFSQNYTNYRLIYVDDCSTDATVAEVKRVIAEHKQEHRTTLICNKERRGALANLYATIHRCPDTAIVVTVDGDDQLAHPDVLTELNRVYTKKSVWLTHGKLLETESKGAHWCIPVPGHVVTKNKFRSFRCPSHLRTFYAWLFKRIRIEDLQYEGRFFPMTWDQAMMFPMIEMAGERHAFINSVNYLYNTTTNLNDNKVDPELQRNLETYIRNLPPYKRLGDGYDKQLD